MSGPVANNRRQEFEGAMAGNFQKMERDLAAEPQKVSVRDVSNGALFAALAGAPQSESEALLEKVFDVQNMNPDSPDYGNLPWDMAGKGVVDANSIEFGTQAWGPLLLRSGGSSSAVRDEASAHVTAALAALQRHHPPVSYTNIFLMNTVNTLLLSTVAGDSVQHQRGLAQLAEWMAYTRANGIHEFDSPTYYSTCLNSLLAGYHYTRDDSVRRDLASALAYFWTDIQANHLAGCEHPLVGAHSRDYDFLYGTGGVADYLYAEGILPTRPFKALDLEKVYLIDNQSSPAGFHPALMPLEGTRTILQKWDADPERTRTTYVTPQFALGTATADYGPQDKLFAVDFATPKKLPSITLVPDTTDNPYGEEKTKDKSGHSKPHHAPLHPAMVQDEGVALILLDLDPAHEKEGGSFTTNLILPAQADEILLDGQRIDGTHPFAREARAGSIIAVRENQAWFVARVFQVDADAGAQPSYELRGDEAGLKKGALRYVVRHAGGLNFFAKLPHHLRLGMIVEAGAFTGEAALQEEINNLSTLRIDQATEGAIWTARTTVHHQSLSVSEDLEHHRQIASSAPLLGSPLMVNGQPIRL